MKGKAKEAGLMKLDKLIANRQRIPDCEIPIPIKELCERYEKLYTGAINDVMRELCLLNQNLPSDIMPLRDEMVVRDTKQILEQKFPVFYKYRTSNGSLGRCMITHYQVPVRPSWSTAGFPCRVE